MDDRLKALLLEYLRDLAFDLASAALYDLIKAEMRKRPRRKDTDADHEPKHLRH